MTELRNLIREAIIDLNAQSIYAQSWSKSESEGLWYRYGADQKSIRLTVELESILSAIKTRWPRVEHFDVEYCSSDDAYIRVLDRFNAGDTNITSCCRYKRPEFRYEEEYRFCLFQAPKGYENIDLYSFDFNEENDLKKALNGLQGYQPDNVKEYDFNPELIKEITLDPRLDPKTQDWFERAIRNLCKAKVCLRKLHNPSFTPI